MMIDWLHFSPWTAALGGLLIGMAAAALILFNGRVAGISGIVGGLLRPQRNDIDWRLAFVAGLIAAPLLYRMWAPLPPIQIDATPFVLAIAGVLVGFGTRLGSGCTSGHGVCGLSRLSPRSMVATAIFMAAGFLTAYIMRHLIGT